MSRSLPMQRIITILLLALACTVNAETIIGRVVGVADGDTITVLDANKVQHKIRLSGIDAPEKKQPFGNRSKESLSGLAFDKTVDVETSKRDRYGRQVGQYQPAENQTVRLFANCGSVAVALHKPCRCSRPGRKTAYRQGVVTGWRNPP